MRGQPWPRTFMCLRHSSVYAPWGFTPVRADRCPLPPDDVGHGDTEAGEDEGGVTYPQTWQDWHVDGYDGPTAEQIRTAMLEDGLDPETGLLAARHEDYRQEP